MDSSGGHSRKRNTMRAKRALTLALFACASVAIAQQGAAPTLPPAEAPVQPAAKKVTPNPWKTPRISRFDLFAGYSYWKPFSKLSTGTDFLAIEKGSIASGSYYFNRHWGFQGEASFHPETNNDGLNTYTAGVIYRMPHARFTPFLHANGGMSELTGANIPTIGGSSFFYNKSKYFPTGIAGGGLDLETGLWHNSIAIRLAQADYQYIKADYGPVLPTSGGTANLSAARLSAGLVVHAGNMVPEPKLTYSCSASPNAVFPGETVDITGVPDTINPDKPLRYTWVAANGKLIPSENHAKVYTSDLVAGTYDVNGTVVQGVKPNEQANCRVSFSVQTYSAPVIACTANPAHILAGDAVTITTTARSPQGLPLTYSYSSTSGVVTGTGTTARLITNGAQPGDIKVTCNVTDSAGQSASGLAMVTVDSPILSPTARTQRLCTLRFTRDKRNPTRVDNEAKACLDEVALSLQRNSTARLVVVGESDACEENGDKAAAQRVMNTKDYLVAQKGIDPARIELRGGTSAVKQVDNYLVPPGANFTRDVPGTLPVDESRLHAIPRTRVPVRRAGAKTKRPVARRSGKASAARQ